MIERFKHKGLKRLFEHGDRSKINPNHVQKIERILAQLDAAETVEHMRQPGYRLHELHGDLRDFYAVNVSGNWRIVFKFKDGKAKEIDLVDYH